MTRTLLSALLASTALIPAMAHAQALPTGGAVMEGAASVRAPAGGAMTIDQHSRRAVIDWQDFSIGEGGRVDILQPDSHSALLNRVTGAATSTIAGQISANGQVFLVNPNGILITESGSVDAGGFVASTLDLSDDAFMRDRLDFRGSGGSVVNRGDISIAKGGYAALIGGKIDNAGLIAAPLGRVALGSGTRATLDLEGDGFLQVALPGADEGGVAMSGRISADGGVVLLTAAIAREAARHSVNLSGVIEARGVEGRSGAVVLTGGDIALAGAAIDVSGETGGGVVRIGGGRQGHGALPHADTLTVDAASTIRADATVRGDGGDVVLWSDRATGFAGAISARGAGGGVGGEAEVSSKGLLGYSGATDLTGARFGTLLLDPYNVTISNAPSSNQSGFTATGDDSVINAATLMAALGTANVTVSTGSGGGQAGDITVAAPLSWSSGSILTLDAAGAIAINAEIRVLGAGGVSLYAPEVFDVTNRELLSGGLSFAMGAGLTFANADGSAASAPVAGQSLTIDGRPYTLIHSMAELDALDGVSAMDTSGGLGAAVTGAYALAGDLDAAGVTYARYLVQGLTGTGVLEGLGHSISGLTIASSYPDAALIGQNRGRVSNIGLVGGSITSTGPASTGSLVASNYAEIANVYSSAAVTGASILASGGTGGLVGLNQPNLRGIRNAFATGAVTGAVNVGGLVGVNASIGLRDSYAMGAVSGNENVGGLIGSNTTTSVTRVYAAGAVTGAVAAGGLIGSNTGGALSNAWWDIDVSGLAAGGGGAGLNTAQLQNGGTALGAAFAGGTGGLYPYLASFFPNGVHAVSGTTYADLGVTPAARQSVFAKIDGRALPALISGANGYYYFILRPDALSQGESLLTHGAGGAAIGRSDGAPLLAGMNLLPGALAMPTNATTLSAAAFPARAQIRALALAAAGGDADAIAAIDATAVLGLIGAGGGLTLDQPLSIAAGQRLLVQTAAALTVAQPFSFGGGAALDLLGSSIAINAEIRVLGTGGVSLYAPEVFDVTNRELLSGGLSFAMGAGLTFANADGSAASAPVAGQSLTIDGRPYTLIYSMAELDALDDVSAMDTSGGLGVPVTGAYALARDLDAAGVTYARYLVQGLTGTGVLEGLGHSISGLTIVSSYPDAALIGQNRGRVSNIGLAGGVITSTGPASTGSLVASNYAEIANVYSSAAVTGASILTSGGTGGLVGLNQPNLRGIRNSFATGAVTGAVNVGGLVGLNASIGLRDSYAMGAVAGDENVGGLIGSNTTASLARAYATGAVTGAVAAGGLIGSNTGGALANAWWDIDTSGLAGGGGAGLGTAQLQGGAAALDAAFAGGTGGLYPYLRSFFPNGVHAVSGTMNTSGGAIAAGGQVGVYAGGALLGGGTVSTGANGYFYAIAPAGAFTATGNALGVTLQLAGAAVPAGLVYRDGLSLDPQGNLALGTLRTGVQAISTGRQYWSAVTDAFGPAYSDISAALAAVPLEITAAGAFTVDAPIVNAAPIRLETGGDLILAAGGVVSSQAAGDAVVLASGGSFVNQAGSAAVTAANGRWLIYSSAPAGDAQGGLVGRRYYGNAYSFLSHSFAAAPNAGNRFVYAMQPTLTITPDTTAVTYSGAVQTGSFTVTGLQSGGNLADALQGTVTGLTTSSANVGSYLLTAGGALTSDENYAIAFGSGTLTISPATLYYTADLQSRVYGGGNPAFTGTVTGLVGGDTLANSTTGALAFSSAATPGSNVGSYAVTGSGLTSNNGNYVFAQAPGNATALSITPRPLTITADAISRIYGEANPLSGSATGDNLVNGDAVTSVALASAATTASSVGSYNLTASAATGQGLSNYTISYATRIGGLTVTARALTITADAISRIYGDANPPLTYAIGGMGLTNGDALSGALATNAARASDVGLYAITQGSLAASGNYDLSFTGADLTITPRPLTITANAASRTYGDPNPALGYALGGRGLVNGDRLSGPLVTPATSASGVGDYAIVQGDLTAGANYLVTYNGAFLTITPRALVITPAPVGRIYGDANPFTGEATGDNLVNGDRIASVGLISAAGRTSGIGDYDLTAAGATGVGLANYAIVYATLPGGLSILPRPLVIAADAQMRPEGWPNPALTYRIGGGGLVNGDTLSGALATDATADSPTGVYWIAQGSLAASPNYEMSYVGNSLSVFRAAFPSALLAGSIFRDAFSTDTSPRPDSGVLDDGSDYPPQETPEICPRRLSCIDGSSGGASGRAAGNVLSWRSDPSELTP